MKGSEKPRWDGDVRSAVRVYGGWIVALIGAILCAVGWYGVSGEKYEARQIPYLASATVPGGALIIAGAVLIAARTRGSGAGTGSDDALRRQVAELHALILEPVAADASARSATTPTVSVSTRDDAVAPDAPFVALAEGARYHRPECELVRGKRGVYALGAERAEELGLRACALCDPDDTGETPAARGGSARAAEPPPGPDFDVD